MTCAEWLKELLENNDEERKQLLADLDLLIHIEQYALKHQFKDFDLLSHDMKELDVSDLKIRIKEMADFVRRRFPDGLPPRVQ
jgi:hypothetical protein